MPTFKIVEAVTNYVEYTVNVDTWEAAKLKFEEGNLDREGEFLDWIDSEIVEILNDETGETLWERD